MRRTFVTMGTVASVDLAREFEPLVDDLERLFRDAENLYSLYHRDSELSRIATAELSLAHADKQLLDTYARALEWSSRTGGAFTPHRPDGVIDLNGIVKADAIASAADVLDGAGCHAFSINVGGDILVGGVSDAGNPWTIGIADPHKNSDMLCSLPLTGTRQAIATSGSAQRGDHIWLGGRIVPADFAQVTVVADDIVTADVLATAIVAGGPDLLDEVCDRWEIDVLTVDRRGALLATPGIRTLVTTA